MSTIFLLWTIPLLFHCLCAQDFYASCTSGCVRGFVDGVSGQLPTAKGKLKKITWQEILDISSTSSDVDVEKQTFRVICRQYKVMRRCTKECGQDQPHHMNIINSTFSAAEHICVTKYYPFQRHLPCFAKHSQKITEKCQELHNGTKIFATETITSISADKAKPKLTELLANLCEITHRVSTCLIPETLKACGMDAAQLIEEIVELNIANLIYLHKTLRLKDPLPHQCEKEVKTPTTATETLPAAGATFVDKNIWDATTFTPSVRHVTPLNPHRFLTTIKSRIKPVVTGRTITHTKFATTVPISDNSQASNNKSVRNQISFLVVLVMFLTSVLAVN